MARLRPKQDHSKSLAKFPINNRTFDAENRRQWQSLTLPNPWEMEAALSNQIPRRFVLFPRLPET
jgi:hypothetical protein